MKDKKRSRFCISICLLAAFLIWTALICFVDVKAIGPQNSCVGFSTVNNAFHNLTGVHMSLYTLTDWLSLIPLFIAMAFAAFGLAQWIKRKSLSKVDRSILILGGFYVVVMAAYAAFEKIVINYRPVLIDGILEASYPSSTTLLVMCIMPTALMQLCMRMKNASRRRVVSFGITVFTIFMVAARLISGVHWLTDIIGGALLSAGLVAMYSALC